MIIKNKMDLIGNTPLVYLSHYSKKYNCNIYLKLEKYNFTYSSKDRIVKEILLNAINDKKIDKNTVIIEATSGNTGISLACICNMLKIKCIIVTLNNISEERKQLLKIYNAKVVYVDSNKKIKGAIKKAKELSKKIKNSYLFSQFKSDDNYLAHYKHTAKEIINDLKNIDCFFSSYGTSGTIVGIAKALKEYNEKIRTISVVPDNMTHKVEGVYSNIKSSFFDKSNIDKEIKISDVDTFKMQKELVKNESLFLGLSSALTFAGALKYIKTNKCNNIVVFCPDGGERYLSNKFCYKQIYTKENVQKDINYIYKNLFVNKNFIYDDVFFKYNISTNNVIKLKKMLLKDAQAIFNIDPACNSVLEVIQIYNSFFAILCYRFANFIYKNYSKKIGRIISEYAHEKTAIDIHPQANIASNFAIDHGSGIVIGQTCKIGKNVTLYHGVTLGAKSVKNKEKIKRHPTILKNVTIYANSTILGGKTIIGNNCIIGCNKVITNSIKDNTIVK